MKPLRLASLVADEEPGERGLRRRLDPPLGVGGHGHLVVADQLLAPDQKPLVLRVEDSLLGLRPRKAADAVVGVPPGTALDALNAALPEGLARLRLRRHGGGYEWDWEEGETRLDRMLWPVVRSAAELLVSPERDRVRECASESCAWLFLDTSRNRSRRWCDMTVCGNRDKVRRFYERRKRGRR